MCSSSDLAALSRLKTFADSLPVVRAELNTGDAAMACTLSGRFSVEANEGFKIEGESSLLTFEEDNVATCTFGEGLAFPSEVDLAVATTGLTIPFAKVSLLNEIRIFRVLCPLRTVYYNVNRSRSE